ncbi:unnamed protein product [Boreogadus saida]
MASFKLSVIALLAIGLYLDTVCAASITLGDAEKKVNSTLTDLSVQSSQLVSSFLLNSPAAGHLEQEAEDILNTPEMQAIAELLNSDAVVELEQEAGEFLKSSAMTDVNDAVAQLLNSPAMAELVEAFQAVLDSPDMEKSSTAFEHILESDDFASLRAAAEVAFTQGASAFVTKEDAELSPYLKEFAQCLESSAQ